MLKTRSRIMALFLAAGLAVLVSACPYQLVKDAPVELPAGIKSLAIPLARNLTIEAGLEDRFTQELIKSFRADGRVVLLPPGRADAELQCALEKLEIATVAYSKEGRTNAESAAVTAQCVLVTPASQSQIWKTGDLTAAEEYPVGNDYLANENVKAAALAQVCLDLAESIRSLLLDRF